MSAQIDFSPNSVIASDIVRRHGVPNSPMTRFFDITFILLALPSLLVVFLLISISIVVDSRGGVLYGQTRIGRGGRRFKALKFRTMVPNADDLLQHYLDRYPELKAEWLATHKLKKDPRVTRVGAILRKLSLDELPQFWNILIGDMSLIGPRPIVEAEIQKYGKCFDLYIQARPGLTGLWQVSGRSDTSYDRRVALDEYYLLNRSIKLDFLILVKTVYVVLGRKGAY
jgi:lipopolysaccharide/colanic/teichoic acid biosynthesis glycosyltransferase